MSSGRESKSYSPASEEFQPKGQSHPLPNAGLKSPASHLQIIKAIKPIRPLPSHLDPELQKKSTALQKATQDNAKSKLFKLPNALFGLVSPNLEANEVANLNRTCRESNRLLENEWKAILKEKQPLLQKLLQYVVDADYDHTEEFIKWHYRFQFIEAGKNIPEPPEKDVIYVKKNGNDLEYSLMTTDGQDIKQRPITLKDLQDVKVNSEEKDKKSDQKIEIPANFSKDNLKALRPLILAITHKNQYTHPKNNRCLLMMSGEVGCDLYLMPDAKNMQDSDPNHLRLYRKDEGLVYRIKGTEYKFDDAALNVEVAKLFDKADLNKQAVLANNNLKLPHNLKWPQIEACKKLLAETAKRGHSSYVFSGQRIRGSALGIALGAEDVSRATHPDEGMAEMLITELRKLPEGEAYIDNQIKAQFPEGWEAKEDAKHAADLIALRKIREAIKVSRSNADPELIAAIHEFKEYIEPKGIIERGKHWNARLLQAALQIGWDKWFGDNRKDDFFYNQVVGSIDTHTPTNYAMAQAQGLCYLLEKNEKFNRSLEYRQNRGNYYYPLSAVAGFRLGSDSWVDCYYGALAWAWPVGRGWEGLLRYREVACGRCFEKLMSSKNSRVAKLMQRPGNPAKSSGCSVM